MYVCMYECMYVCVSVKSCWVLWASLTLLGAMTYCSEATSIDNLRPSIRCNSCYSWVSIASRSNYLRLHILMILSRQVLQICWDIKWRKPKFPASPSLPFLPPSHFISFLHPPPHPPLSLPLNCAAQSKKMARKWENLQKARKNILAQLKANWRPGSHVNQFGSPPSSKKGWLSLLELISWHF